MVVAFLDSVSAEQMSVELFDKQLRVVVVVGIFVVERVAFVDVGQNAFFLH